MRSIRKAYESPSLEAKGDAVAATRAKDTGQFEPATILPRDSAGEVGFGL
jgi:hypothetical protein